MALCEPGGVSLSVEFKGLLCSVGIHHWLCCRFKRLLCCPFVAFCRSIPVLLFWCIGSILMFVTEPFGE